jgi:hypothetical protein
MAMELILKNGTVTIPQAIENIQLLKQELADRLNYYKTLVVTEDGIKDAKADKANLNKLKTAIDNQRKEAKHQTMALYEPLEKECKELLSMIDEPIAAIDGQIKAFDEKKRAEKYAALVEFFGQINTLDFVKIENVLNPKWGNVTVKIDTLKNEMSAAVQAIVDDYMEIKKLYADSPMLTAIMQKFETTRDKGAALAYAAEIERKEQQRKAAEEAQKKAWESTEPPMPSKFMPPEPEPIPVEKSFTPPEETVIHTTVQPEPTITGTFRVTGTRAQLIALREFLKSNGLDFEIVR